MEIQIKMPFEKKKTKAAIFAKKYPVNRGLRNSCIAECSLKIALL